MKKLFLVLALAITVMHWGCGSNSAAPTTPGPSGPTYTYPYLLTIGDTGVFGSGNGQLSSPYGVAIYNSSLFVADYGNNRVEKFDLNGNFLGAYTGAGFNGPTGIAVSKTGTLFVSEFSNNRIQKLDQNGNYISSFGSLGTGLTNFNGPFGIAVDTNSNVYVGDLTNHRLLKCDSNGAGGVTVNGFNYIVGVAIDGSGNVWTADENAALIQKFNSSLVLQSSFGTGGAAAGKLADVRGIVIDSDGNIIEADGNGYRVQKFSPSGTYLGSIGTTGPGANPGQLNYPNFVTVDNNKDVYVSDSNNSTVIKFAPY